MTALERQLDYYRARASEYDEWFFRLGRYDRGPAVNQKWHDDVAIVRKALDRFRPNGDLLELACGTGLWTGRLARHADSVLALDGAAEMLAINRDRIDHPNVTFLQANIFQWTPERQFDVVFFGFWLSHVPKDKFQSFWNLVRSALKPKGRVFFVDSLPNPEARAKNRPLAKSVADLQTRYLNDGRSFEIVKRFFDPDQLSESLASLHWQANIQTTDNFFLYGEVSADRFPTAGRR